MLQINEQAQQPLDRRANEIPTSRAEIILKSMQTPQILRDLPCFAGDTVKLNSFIKAIDNIMPLFGQVEGTPIYTVWMQAIRSKIIAEADSVLELYGTEANWEDIKTTLITHFSDKRDEASLTKELLRVKQTGTAEELYGTVSHYLSLLINLMNLNEQNVDVIAAKKTFFQELGLKVFLAELVEPPGHTIRAQSPKTLREALRICLDEINFTSGKNYTRAIAQPGPSKQTPPLPPRKLFIQQPFPRFQQQQFPKFQQQQPFPRFSQQFPKFQQQPFPRFPQQQFPKFQQQQQQPFPRFPQQTFPRFHQQQPYPKFSQQPIFRPNQFQLNPNNQNVFAPRPVFQPKPVPMEVDQSIRSRGINYMNRPNFHMEYELFDNDNYYPQYQTDNNYYYYPEQLVENDLAEQPAEYTQIDQTNETHEPTAENEECETQQNKQQNVDDLNFLLADGPTGMT